MVWTNKNDRRENKLTHVNKNQTRTFHEALENPPQNSWLSCKKTKDSFFQKGESKKYILNGHFAQQVASEVGPRQL